MLQVLYKRGLLKMVNAFEVTNIKECQPSDTVITTNVIFPGSNLEWNSDDKAFVYLLGKTSLIHLNREEEEIFADIHKNTRYKINRAEKRDPIQCYVTDSPSDVQLQQFVTFFNSFAKHKQIQAANLERLKSFRDRQAIIYSYVTDEKDRLLCAHIHYIVNNYSCLLYSASARFENSQIRNMIGRANRLLHWQDIKLAKAKGLTWYNFGGISTNEKDIPHQKINQFKMEFGGQIVDVLTSVYGITMFGKCAAFLYKLKAKHRPEYITQETVNKHSTYSH
ncbi:peptidoglycan bridge formation glycyltransferase FemA/FemB family protein [Ornithinibacillus sp. BX22]|uniref:Lipid II:glycine glycyltransferase n=1 Tax=Ornithinibacillus hominis TaxID=2763055 RepID=A0A923L7U5_9BACI|nr:peptidoglycan bridge formation glycyltransferase FemA/FemB family protein [Ornithinibacillus hominis]MBC5637997.1 peptidoglycan bridge formation glycyltransferase FemA/FemB family protein [Ornithinibacillus hominis]